MTSVGLGLSGLIACGPSVAPPMSSATGDGTTEAAPSTSVADSSTSASVTVTADDSSTGSGLMEFVGFWNQGYSDVPDPHRYFSPCGLDEGWDIEGAIPGVDDCDTSAPRYVRVLGELIPGEFRPTLVVSEILEGPCWKHSCDGGDPCDCGTLDDVCNGPSGLFCDLFQQTCPEGEKCMPWAGDGGTQWSATRCSPIADDPGGPGEPCTVEGSFTSGIDDCAAGTMCWNVDPMTNTGTCAAMCTVNACSPEPSCDEPGTACAIAYDGNINLCLPMCDPLAPACSPGHGCRETEGGFFCLPGG